MAVGSDTQHDLMRRHARGGPSGDGTDGTPHLIGGGRAGVVERGVGTDGRAPRTPDIVVHDGNEVQDGGEARDVGAGRAGLILPRQNGGRSRDDEVLSSGISAQLLEEAEEVGSVVRAESVATNSGIIRVFPARWSRTNLDVRNGTKAIL